MPHITKEEVAAKRKELKREFPDFKFSVRTMNHSKISVAIMSGPIPMTDSENGYSPVNHFYVDDNYKDRPEVRDVLSKVVEIASRGNRTVSTDGDYGNIPKFYVDVTIGKWDKPYVVAA